jgi:hypothetical protein
LANSIGDANTLSAVAPDARAMSMAAAICGESGRAPLSRV